MDQPPVVANDSIQPTKADTSHVTWSVVRETWITELRLPPRKVAAAASRAWHAMHQLPDQPTLEAVLAGLRRDAPRWSTRAAELAAARDPDPWRFCPGLDRWLGDRGWELGPDPVPRAAGADGQPALDGVARNEIQVLRTKAEAAERRGDRALAADYRAQADRIRNTGRVA